MKFIDTHTHLFLEEFNDDKDQVITTALESGIIKLLMPNIDRETLQPLLTLHKKYPEVCLPMIGLHPISVRNDPFSEMQFVKNEVRDNKYVAIGETGIDLYRDASNLKNQQTAFRTHLELAIEYNLPVVIHARNAFAEIFEIIREFDGKGLKGVFHAFTGSVGEATFIIDREFKLGIGGIVTFKNSHLDETLQHFSLDHIILETDSPYLAPVPHRGKRNESKYIIKVAEKLAEIFRVTLDEVAEATTRNACQLFNLYQ